MRSSHRARPSHLSTALIAAFCMAAPAAAQPATPARPAKASPKSLDIPYEQFTLPNGLRVVVHTDRKAPIVAVNVWYHVGSKNEPLGRSGFAHLFEHLMFQGSENHAGEFFEPFELVGATEQNGTTNQDRTNYFQNVPTTALELALWMESDRMGHLLGAIDQAALDEQRGVVQNEKRQGENQPYGRVWQALLEGSYPAGHPYHHTVIGSMNDLGAASLEDVKNWFRSWYGPNNAVLVLAGDIDLATAKQKVARYFADIPPSAAVRPMRPQIARRTTSSRATMTDAVPQARVVRSWNVPPATSGQLEHLQLLAQVLGGSRSSRLDRRLVFQDKLVDNVWAAVNDSELGSLFLIQADIKQGVDPAKVELAISEEIEKLLTAGPTSEEVERARTVLTAQFVRGVERIGGFGGKADVLAECAVFAGKPGCFREALARLAKATAGQVRAAGRSWLARGDFTLLVTPGERAAVIEEPAITSLPPSAVAPPARGLRALPSEVDRKTGVPMPEAFPALRYPELARRTLSNGIQVVLAARPGLPLVQLAALFPGGGFAADSGRKAGTASFTMGMLDEGAGTLDALALGDKLESLGATLSVGATLDAGTVRLSALADRLGPSLALLGEVLMRPRLDEKDLARVRAEWLASIKQEKARPASLARRIAQPILFGQGHPYAIPPSGSGTEAGISSLTRDDLLAHLRDHVRPDNAVLLVVGDTTIEELSRELEAALGAWKAPATPRRKTELATVKHPSKPRVFLVDQPGAIQANLFVGLLAPSSKDAGAIELELANGVLGGEFSSRLNMNLRENKHWAYGAFSGASNAVGQRVWAASAAVQIDKTADSLAELAREIREFATGKAPATDKELRKLQATEVRALPGSFETASALLGSMSALVLYGRPDDYEAHRAARIQALTPAQVQAAAATLRPDALTWVVIGDLKKIEAPVRALGLGEVKVLDADGNTVAR